MTTATLSPSVTVHSNLWERLVAAFGAARVLYRDPNRLDQVLVFLQAVNIGAVKRRIRDLGDTPAAQKLLREQPHVDERSIDYDALARLPDGTLGREYVRFLRDNGISPAPFEVPPDLGDPRASYLVMRLRQTHDLWHVVTGYEPDVEGELLLQAFTFAQTGAPGSALIATLGSLKHAWKIRHHARHLIAAYRRGKAAAGFPLFAWEEHFERPLEEVRRELACAA